MRKLKISALIFLGLFMVLFAGGWIFMQTAVFGAEPTGARLARIKASSHYLDGAFQNIEPTEVMRPDASYLGMLREYFNKPRLNVPDKPLPSVRTDLVALKADTPTIVWFGHSSYLIKSAEGNILVDPVFSGNASPVAFFAKAFPGADMYAVDDMPPIDVLILTHDHYDHLDYKTIREMGPKVGRIVTALGVGAHLERWGIPADKITELEWWESSRVSPGIALTSTPARHFSGRSFKRGGTLWSSFVLELGRYKLFLGGDSGYDPSFRKIGETYGPFDIALLECGQYGDNWPMIHMKPEETAQAALDLNTKVLMPVHWAKFTLAMHEWTDPINRVTAAAPKLGLKLTTPRIGEPVQLEGVYPSTRWWEVRNE